MRQEVMANNTYYLQKVIYADNGVAVAFLGLILWAKASRIRPQNATDGIVLDDEIGETEVASIEAYKNNGMHHCRALMFGIGRWRILMRWNLRAQVEEKESHGKNWNN